MKDPWIAPYSVTEAGEIVRGMEEIRVVAMPAGTDELQDGAMQLQTFHHTSVNRYPEIFDFVQRLSPTPERILSFGCSSGEELLTLKRRYPKAQLFGLDLSADMLKRAEALVPTATFAHVLPQLPGDYNLVFAMSVLCRWPEPHPNGPLPYEDFAETVRALADSVRAGGHLVIANASYNANPLLVDLGFAPVCSGLPTGFVTMRERDGSTSVDKRCVWRKS